MTQEIRASEWAVSFAKEHCARIPKVYPLPEHENASHLVTFTDNIRTHTPLSHSGRCMASHIHKQPIYKYNFSWSWAAVSAQLRVYRFEPRCFAGGKPLLKYVRARWIYALLRLESWERNTHKNDLQREIGSWVTNWRRRPHASRLSLFIAIH